MFFFTIYNIGSFDKLHAVVNRFSSAICCSLLHQNYTYDESNRNSKVVGFAKKISNKIWNKNVNEFGNMHAEMLPEEKSFTIRCLICLVCLFIFTIKFVLKLIICLNFLEFKLEMQFRSSENQLVTKIRSMHVRNYITLHPITSLIVSQLLFQYFGNFLKPPPSMLTRIFRFWNFSVKVFRFLEKTETKLLAENIFQNITEMTYENRFQAENCSF